MAINKSDTPLTTPAPEKNSDSEEALRLKFGASVFAFTVSVLVTVLMFAGLVYVVNLEAYGIEPAVSWQYALLALAGSVLAIVASFKFANRFEKALYYNYRYVPKGKVTKLDFIDGRYVIIIQGSNRMKQLRTYTCRVNAKEWQKDTWVVGDSVTTSEIEEV